MDKLLQAITELASDTHPDKVAQLADLVRVLDGVGGVAGLNSWAVTVQSRERLNRLVDCWRETEVSAIELAGMLTCASYAYQSAKDEESVELVWTGPNSELVSTRHTEQVLLEVIQAARQELFLVSFVTYEVPSVMNALAECLGRGVKVSMLIESSDAHGGKISVDSVAKMKESLQNASVYVWSSSEKQATSGGFGAVHAKCAVADGRVAFITSANLTAAALQRNMELGVLVRGDRLPKQLHSHLKAMVTTRTIVEA